MNALKSLMRDSNASDVIDMFIKMKINFDLYCSNYTMKIVTADNKINFTKNNQSRQCFAAYSKVKMDLKNKPIPDISADDISYFIHDFKQPLYVEEVCNIDLKSAYANILLMDGLISKETFKYLSGIPKKERLSSVGMLASHKEIYSFRNNNPVTFKEERSELAPFFFYAVKRTSEIMHELKKICNNDYLFTWVDGIYFLPNPITIKKCKEFLSTISLPYATEFLKEFEVKFLQRSIAVSFKKEDKVKRFDLPLHDNEFRRIAGRALVMQGYTKVKKRSLLNHNKTKNK